MSSNTDQFVRILRAARKLAGALCSELAVSRCALVSDGSGSISLIPLHGTGPDWKPITASSTEFNATYPGYITSKNGPRMTDKALDENRDVVTRLTGLREPFDRTFCGELKNDNLFARIIRQELPQWRVWENCDHVAFLTPFANSPGFTVLVPRTHLSSNIFGLSNEQYVDTVLAGHRMGRILMDSFKIKRCGMIFEGFEVDYAHVKLIPIFEKKELRAFTCRSVRWISLKLPRVCDFSVRDVDGGNYNLRRACLDAAPAHS